MPSRSWDVDKVHTSFLPPEVDLIIYIPLAQSTTLDSLCWHFENKRVYYIKSGYKLANMMARTDSSFTNVLKFFWSTVRGTRLPRKILVFIWCAYLNAIPTGENLTRHGIRSNSGCSR